MKVKKLFIDLYLIDFITLNLFIHIIYNETKIVAKENSFNHYYKNYKKITTIYITSL